MTSKEFIDMVNLLAEVKRLRDTEMAERLNTATAEVTRLETEAATNRKAIHKALPNILAEYHELKRINPRSETQQAVFTKLEQGLAAIDNCMDMDPELVGLFYK